MRRESSSTVVYLADSFVGVADSDDELKTTSPRSRSSSFHVPSFHAAGQLIQRRWHESRVRAARALIARQEGARDERVCGMWAVRRPAGQRRAPRAWQKWRLGGATAGHHGPLRLHLKA